jgi:hypothetical protein
VHFWELRLSDTGEAIEMPDEFLTWDECLIRRAAGLLTPDEFAKRKTFLQAIGLWPEEADRDA